MQEEPLSSTEAARPERVSVAGLLLRAGFFVLTIWFGLNLFGLFIHETLGYFPAATLSPFLAAARGTPIVVRI
jgi:hypothetical protein